MSHPIDFDLVARKRAIRAEVRRGRRERSDADRAAADAAIARHATRLVTELGASTVALYLSLPDEPGTRGLLASLARAGVLALLPRPRGDRGLEWVPAGGGERISAGLGTPEPIGVALQGDPLDQTDLVLIPACAADRSGGRLGWGGGFYDRALARMRAAPHPPPIVAVVFDEDVRDDLPIEPHDQPVDGVLTPSGLSCVGTRTA